MKYHEKLYFNKIFSLNFIILTEYLQRYMLDHLLCFMHHCSFNHAICVTTQKISWTNRTYQHHRN